MDRMKFDIMCEGTYIHTMTYEYCRLLPIDITDLWNYVVGKLPTLRSKRMEIVIYGQHGNPPVSLFIAPEKEGRKPSARKRKERA